MNNEPLKVYHLNGKLYARFERGYILIENAYPTHDEGWVVDYANHFLWKEENKIYELFGWGIKTEIVPFTDGKVKTIRRAFYLKKIASKVIPDVIDLEHERLKWSLETFTEATPLSSLFKCQEEIEEIKQDLAYDKPNPEEYADAVMCLFDSAGRAGIDVEQIIEAFEKKLEINKARVWKKNPDNLYSHVK